MGKFSLVFNAQTPLKETFMSLFYPMALAHQRVNTLFFNVCGDNVANS